jgi:hypothetical protein
LLGKVFHCLKGFGFVGAGASHGVRVNGV